MNKLDWAVVVKTWDGLWPNHPMKPTQAEVWFRKFHARDKDDLLTVLWGLSELDDRFPPSIGQVHQALIRHLRRKAIDAPQLPPGNTVTEGEYLWSTLDPEERRTCVKLAIEDVPDGLRGGLAGTVDEPTNLLLVGARFHALVRAGRLKPENT